MKTEITINKDKLLAAYNSASDEQKRLLESMYGKDTFKSVNVMDRIKTFEDACSELGHEHHFVKLYEKYMNTYGEGKKEVISYLKLRIVTSALNEGWKPNFYGEEYGALSDKEKKEILVVDISPLKGWVAHVGVDYATSDADVDYGVQFAFKTRELAVYCGKQFIDLWFDYLFS